VVPLGKSFLMKNVWIGIVVCVLVLSGVAHLVAAQTPETVAGAVELRVDNLKNPLGIDDAAPKFSWQLRDPAPGAKQTAYEVLVASSPELLAQGKADVWDSGRMASGQSLNVSYGGPELKPSTRYSWCVKGWGADGKAYAAGETGWFETGLISQDAWKSQWIGYETPEEATVRHEPAEWIANTAAARTRRAERRAAIWKESHFPTTRPARMFAATALAAEPTKCGIKLCGCDLSLALAIHPSCGFEVCRCRCSAPLHIHSPHFSGRLPLFQLP